MAKNEEIDDVDTGKGTTVMVGGMDDLVPGGKAKEKDDLVVEVDDGRSPTTQRATTTPPAGDPDDDDREEDARLAYDIGADDEIEERGLSRRQRRNKSRRTVVAGRDQEINELRQQITVLSGMVGQMGQSQVGLTAQSIENQLGAAQQALVLADAEIRKAIAEGNLARYDELRGLKDEAQARVFQLNGAKRQLYADVQQRSRGQAQPMNGGGQPQGQPNASTSLSQRAQDFTETFMSRFPDFDPSGNDENTLVMKAIDDSVAAEGYRPDTPMYWRVLEKKLAARGIYPDDGGDDGNGDDRVERRERTERREPVARRSGGRPPTSGGSANRRGSGTTFRLDPMMRDYLDGEGILHAEGLDDNQKAKRTRLINEWREGQRKLARGELNR